MNAPDRPANTLFSTSIIVISISCFIGFSFSFKLAHHTFEGTHTKEIAVLAIAETSAPLKPFVISAICIKSISRPIDLPFVCTSRILNLVFLSGFSTQTILSNLPGLKSIIDLRAVFQGAIHPVSCPLFQTKLH